MRNSALVCALAVTLTVASLPADAQGRVRDPNASNNPEIYQQTHPEDTSGRSLQGAPISRGERRELERRQSDRGEFERREAQRQEAQRQEAQRRENGRDGHGRRDQIQHGQDWRDHNRQNHGWQNHSWPNHSRPNHGWQNHHRPIHQWHDHNRSERYYYGARGPEFLRGGYLPYEYRARQYWVDDWHWRGLSAPPSGHHWVQIGPDYALIAIATGLIAYLVVNQ